MKKSILIIAMGISGTTAFAQQTTEKPIQTKQEITTVQKETEEKNEVLNNQARPIATKGGQTSFQFQAIEPRTKAESQVEK